MRRKDLENMDLEELKKELLKSLTKLAETVKDTDIKDPRRKKVMKEKAKLIERHEKNQRDLAKVTHNTYVEIAEILNRQYNKIEDIMEETIEEIKNWLDDNNKPYRNCDCDDEEEDEDIWDIFDDDED